MRRNEPRSVARALAATLALPLVAGGQGSSRDETALHAPTPATVAVWTDRLGYTTWLHTVRAYLAMDPMDDRGEYFRTVYLEHVASGERRYWQRPERQPGPTGGPPGPWLVTGRIPAMEPVRLRWSGRVAEPGLWRFVVELRSADRTELVKRAAAGFVVSFELPLEVGQEGSGTEILADTVWGRDRIRVVRGPVFVREGSTLTLEAGALVLARGARAAIVVERGARIVAEGRPDAPVVLSCEAPVGKREPGCWGGLAVLGRSPAERRDSAAAGVEPEARGAFGGDEAADSSGVLRYVRVEFAGGGAYGAGIGLHGVGAGTRIDHVQSHASGSDGIRLAGGTVSCRHCVASGSRGHGLSWDDGWQGAVQHLYVQQDDTAEGCGIDANRAGSGGVRGPGGGPRLFNLTLVGPGGDARGCQVGMRFRGKAAGTVSNLAVTGFGTGFGFEDERARRAFGAAGGSVSHAIFEGAGAGVRHLDKDPALVNVRWGPGPDPRPRWGAAALQVGAAAVPPSDGWLDTSAEYIGAFGPWNWLEGWTFFGPESAYASPGTHPPENGIE
ncbi:MAG: hypothetical protein OXN89_21840 [Bryobacterales bacterium]|nr:hypothetical protein [Bryobacterales bacterium]